MLVSATAVGTALFFSLRHQAALRIKPKERRRYLLKSINLALCYRGFSPSKRLRCARDAGKAAFYCCAYDVVTDWRNYDKSDFQAFKHLLNREVAGNLAVIALRLYEQERNGSLRLDGLSRGIDALEFVTKLIGSDEYIRHNLDFRNLGVVMQIVDDVLDWEDDQRNGELNCLLTSRSQQTKHLRALLAFDMQRFQRILPHATVLCRVIRSAQRKAHLMLSGKRLFLEKLPSVNASPYQNINNKDQAEITSYVGN